MRFAGGPNTIFRPSSASPTSPNDSTTSSSSGAVAWDPEGLLPPPPAGGHFARRGRERGANPVTNNARAPPPGPSIDSLPGDTSEPCIDASDTALYDRRTLAKNLTDNYMDVDLNYPGLKIAHLDPPIFIVEGFFSAAECAAMIDAAVATGRMATSKVGAGNANDGAPLLAAESSRRTSSSVLVDASLLAGHPGLELPVKALQDRGQRLLGGDPIASSGTKEMPWGPPGKLPAPRQFCFEALQVAKYQQGQYFLEHEDAFPVPLARSNMFQRHATLLVYLNDVPQGGATRFEHLNLVVRPAAGRALIFFPAFADGTPDARTLHTAETAEDEKWVTQQWIARGFGSVGEKATALKKKTLVSIEEILMAGKKPKSEKTKKQKTPRKGFGGS